MSACFVLSTANRSSYNVARYLSRHGIYAELDTWVLEEELVPDLLVDYANQKGAGCIVMGGYGHSRAGEFLFGGVTRALLKRCPIALVVSH